MQSGYHGQTFPTQGGMPSTGMPTSGMPFTPPTGFPYGGAPYTPPMGLPYGGAPFTPPMGFPYGGMQPMPYTGAGSFASPFGAFHCPTCGYGGPMWHTGMPPTYGWTGFGGAYPFWTGFGGLGGLRRHGGSYTPQFTATGLPTDEEIVEMVYDAMDVDPLIPYDADINVDCDAGVITLTGTVMNKRAKHAAGDDSWWVPGVVDVRNELQVSGRRRARTAPKETERPS